MFISKCSATELKHSVMQRSALESTTAGILSFNMDLYKRLPGVFLILDLPTFRSKRMSYTTDYRKE